MNRPRLIRWLRIAVSAACMVACCLFVVLWVRSYWVGYHIGVPVTSTRTFHVAVPPGELEMLLDDPNPYPAKWIWEADINDPDEYDVESDPDNEKSWVESFGFWAGKSFDGPGATVPIWFPALISFAFAFVPWLPWHKLRWRFSLRTLLIVTTLVAAVLGFVVWLAK